MHCQDFAQKKSLKRAPIKKLYKAPKKTLRRKK
jgi:hypothetical protein